MKKSPTVLKAIAILALSAFSLSMAGMVTPASAYWCDSYGHCYYNHHYKKYYYNNGY